MQDQDKLPRKERERLARREEILNAARKVFSERGFERATLDEIAVVAEYGKGTIYNYFSSKEELFTSIIERGMTRFQQFVAEAVQDKSSPREKIESYIDAAFEFFENHRPIFSILVLERHNLARSLNGEMCNDCLKHQETILQFLAKLFREGIRSGMFKKLDPTKLAQLLFAMLHDAYRHAVMEPTTTNLKKDAGLIKQIFFDGIAT